MKPLARSESIRTRLLGLMALVVVPVALFSVLIAASVYRSTLAAIERQQANVAQDYATRTTVWFRSIQRTMVTTVNALNAIDPAGGACPTLAQSVLAANPGFRAVHILRGGVPCSANAVDGPSAARLEALAAGLAGLPLSDQFARLGLPHSRLDTSPGEVPPTLALTLSAHPGTAQAWSALLLIDPTLLDLVFAGDAVDTGEVALVDARGTVVAASHPPDAGRGWPSPDQLARAGPRNLLRLSDGSAPGTSFVIAPLAGSSLAVVGRFDESASQAAWRHFLTLVIAPLLVLAAMYLIYARAIRDDVMRWIYEIKSVALDRIANPRSTRLVLTQPAMPRELQRVATAFNQMVSDLAAREAALKDSLAANEGLTRELHHRVKNSLQVIQSYLALSVRLHSGQRRSDLIETGARVQVLSVAYRLALAEGRMHRISAATFAAEVVDNLTAGMRSPKTAIRIEANADVMLHVDRAIPFGLAIVEAVLAARHGTASASLAVLLEEAGPDQVRLTLACASPLPPDEPNSKIMRGLALQLGATMLEPAPHEILAWRFSAPPPVSDQD